MKKYHKHQPPVSLICPECGCIFKRLAYYVRVKHKRNPSGNIYCSDKCARLGRWGRTRSKEVHCSYCGKPFTRQENQLRNRGSGISKLGNFCSTVCYHKWRSENLTGEDSPNWKGGYHYEYGGSHWKRQRRLARKRDCHTCQDCGITEQEWGYELDVHHIVAYDLFDDPKEANHLDNLITLCRKCHAKYHNGDMDGAALST